MAIGTPTWATAVRVNASTAAATTASITPAASDVALACISWQGNIVVGSAPTFTMSNGAGWGTLGTGWTQLGRIAVAMDNSAAYSIIVELWGCKLGASPAGGTVTATRSGSATDSSFYLQVGTVSGADIPVSPNNGTAHPAFNNTTLTATLTSAPAASSMWVGVLGSTAASTVTQPSGTSEASENLDAGFGVAHETAYLVGSAAQANQWSWAGGAFFGSVGAAVEIPVAAGGGAAVSDYAAPWTARPPGRLSPASQRWNPAQGTADAAPVAASGTASLTLSASGSATATAGGTGSLTFGGSGAASAPTSGTGSLSLSGSGTAQTAATGTGSLSLSATGTATSPATGTGSLTLSATGTAVGQGAASGTGSLTLSASGTAQATATGAGSLTLSATGTASGGGAASGSGSITLAATGSTTSPTSGTGALSLTAAGTARTPATGTASLALSATGAATASPSGTGSLTLVGTGTGRAVVVSTASLTLSAAGAISATAGGTASIVLSGLGIAAGPFVADPNPITLTIQETGFRTTVRTQTRTTATQVNRDRTTVGSQTRATASSPNSRTTVREQH